MLFGILSVYLKYTLRKYEIFPKEVFNIPWKSMKYFLRKYEIFLEKV